MTPGQEVYWVSEKTHKIKRGRYLEKVGSSDLLVRIETFDDEAKTRTIFAIDKKRLRFDALASD